MRLHAGRISRGCEDHNIFLDNVLQKHCIAADDEEGWVDVIDGKAWDIGNFQTNRHYGQVRIERINDARDQT